MLIVSADVLLQVLDLSTSLLNNINSVVWLAGGLRSLLVGLKVLNISRCALTPKAVAFLLSRGLAPSPEIRTLTHLDLSDNHLGNEGTEAMCSLLKVIAAIHGHLTVLKLNRSHVDGRTLAAHLMAVPNLVQVSLSGNALSNNGTIGALAVTLRDRERPIVKLDLSSCGLTSEEVRFLSLCSLFCLMFLCVGFGDHPLLRIVADDARILTFPPENR
jgi:Ran GTPase-activating protein (RanGAP) involved in mRNA processing and transport